MSPACAHTASTAWLALTVSGTTVTGQWEIPLRDLDDALGLDADDDGQLTWGELRARHADVAGYALDRLTLRADQRTLALRATEHRLSERSDGPCAVLRFAAEADAPVRDLVLGYRLFFDRDPLHRGLVSFARGGEAPGMAAVLSPEQPEAAFPFRPEAGAGPASFATFIREGVHHIWTGYDHLLFLLALLLPAVLWRNREGWQPLPSFPRALKHVLQVVTAFTLAHSLTLALAAFEVVRLPSRFVESAIAASIIIAAIANLRGRSVQDQGADSPVGGIPRTSHFALRTSPPRPWLMPFAFGLIHGFGFAGVLGELGLSQASLARPLLGFNLGVELGQLACVAVFLPLAFALRGSRFYRLGALPVGSVVILLLAGGWFVERAFDLSFLPF